MPDSIRKYSRLLSASVIDRLPMFVVAFATLMLVTLSYVAVDSSASLVRESLRSKGLAAFSSISNRLISQLSSHANLIRSESASPIVRNALADSEGLQSYLRPHLNSMIQGHDEILSVALIDSVGNELVSINKPGTPAPNSIATRFSIPDLLARGEPDYLMEAPESLILVWPVWFPPTGKNEGLLLARIDLKRLTGLATQTASDASGPTASISFFARTDQSDQNRQRENFAMIPGREFVFSGRLDLPAPFSSHEALIEYRRSSVQEHDAVIQTLWIHVLSMILAWLVFFILAKWIKVRYVDPIRKITAIATSFSSSPDGKYLNEDDGTVERLQKSVQGVIDVLNTTEHSYQEKIQFTALELHQARARLEDIARSGNIIAFSVDLPTGLISYSTDSLTRHLNPRKRFSAGSGFFRWKAAYRLVAKSDRTDLNQGIRRCLRFGYARLQVKAELDNKDFIFDLRLQKSGATAGNLERIDCIALDNTEVAAKELALAQSESRKSAIINGALDGFIALTPDFIVTEVNPAAERLLGRKNIALLGERFVDHCIAPASVKQFLRFCTKLIDSKEGHLRHQGEVIWCRDTNAQNIPVDLSGSLITVSSGVQICLYIKDLRKTFEQQRAIAEKTSEVQTVLDLSPGGFASFNENGQLSAHNRSLEEMLNAGPRFLSGQVSQEAFEELVKQLAISKLRKNLEKLIAPGDRILRINGPKEKLLKCTKRQLDSSTTGKACVYYFTDITQEFQLDTLKSNFLATAAHELRTPLTTILGFSELMSSQDLSPDVQKELISSIFRHSLQLNSLISDLLDLSKIESEGANIFKPEQIDIGELLGDLVHKSSVQKDNQRFIEGHEVSIQLPAESVLSAIADEEKLMRAFQNLLSNATKYSPPESPILITAKEENEDGKPWIKASITDRGIGMTPEEVDHAFVRFWRADSTSGKIPGTGLGLPLVKEIVELHHGHIKIDSQYGKGTTVSIYLPAATQSA